MQTPLESVKKCSERPLHVVRESPSSAKGHRQEQGPGDRWWRGEKVGGVGGEGVFVDSVVRSLGASVGC